MHSSKGPISGLQHLGLSSSTKEINLRERRGKINLYHRPKNTGHLEWNPLEDFSEFKTNGDSKEAL